MAATKELTSGQKAAQTRKRRATALKAAATRKRRATAAKAAAHLTRRLLRLTRLSNCISYSSPKSAVWE